jgi:Protein of unknown function (DUF3106)
MLIAAALLAVAFQTPVPPANFTERPTRPQLAESWDDLSPSQRERALRNYQSYQELPPDKKHDIDRHYEKWKNLPRSDQERYRKKHDEYRGKGLVDD